MRHLSAQSVIQAWHHASRVMALPVVRRTAKRQLVITTVAGRAYQLLDDFLR